MIFSFKSMVFLSSSLIIWEWRMVFSQIIDEVMNDILHLQKIRNKFSLFALVEGEDQSKYFTERNQIH